MTVTKKKDEEMHYKLAQDNVSCMCDLVGAVLEAEDAVQDGWITRA